MEGKGLPSPLDQTRHRLLLGDDAFVERYRQDKKPEELREISKAHRRSIAPPLDDYRQRHSDRNEAMARAYLSGAYTMLEIGAHFGVHYMTVSRAVRRLEQNDRGRLNGDPGRTNIFLAVALDEPEKADIVRLTRSTSLAAPEILP